MTYKFSTLGTAYLSYIDEINAGKLALSADLEKILQEIAIQLGHHHGIQSKREAGDLVVPLRIEDKLKGQTELNLRLRWRAELGWPQLSIDEPPERLGAKANLSRAIFRTILIPQLQKESLLADPVDTSVHGMLRLISQVDSVSLGQAWLVAVYGDTLMREISKSLLIAVIALESTSSEMAPGEVKTSKLWPCYVQWRHSLSRGVVLWSLTLHPNRNGEPWLGLVLYGGAKYKKELLEPLAKTSFEGQPVVAEYSHLLLQLGQNSIQEIAADLVREVIVFYQQFLATFGGS